MKDDKPMKMERKVDGNKDEKQRKSTSLELNEMEDEVETESNLGVEVVSSSSEYSKQELSSPPKEYTTNEVDNDVTNEFHCGPSWKRQQILKDIQSLYCYHHNDDNKQHREQQILLAKEEIEVLMNERDEAKEQAKASKETLSCVMEAVQILTTQMKKTHIEMMASEQIMDVSKNYDDVQTTSMTICASNTRHHLDMNVIQPTISNLSEDFSRLSTNEQITKRVEDQYHDDQSTIDSSIATSVPSTDSPHFHDEAITLPHGNDKYDCADTGLKYRSNHSLASTSVATYMSEESKRFSELLQLSSSSSMPNHSIINASQLQQIKSDLMALGHSCQMVGENAHLLHNEASTFLIDLHDVNFKLNELQLKYEHTERLSLQLYKENKRLKRILEKYKNERRILVNELTMVLEEQATKKDFEDNLLKAWDLHERMINNSASKQSSFAPSTCQDTVDGENNDEDSSSSSQQEDRLSACDSDNNETPSTPLGKDSSSTSIIPPSPMTPAFKEMHQTSPTTSESSNTTYDDNDETENERMESSSKNKTGWISFLPSIQLAPSSSMMNLSKNPKAKLKSLDLLNLEEKENKNNNRNCIDTATIDESQRTLKVNTSTTKIKVTNSPPPTLFSHKREPSKDRDFSSTTTSAMSLGGKKFQLTSLDSSSSPSSSENSSIFTNIFYGGVSSKLKPKPSPQAKSVVAVKMPKPVQRHLEKDRKITTEVVEGNKEVIPPKDKVPSRNTKQYRHYFIS